ncbi:MAG: hypothetical protein LBT99_00880, partial [Bifidobacteriaceae bacterium]|nr:hypothetical protein [Bifidobacteriaceae bacterium]
MKHFNKIDKLSSQSNLVIGSNAICEIMNSDISLIKKVIKLESNKNYISQRQQIILDKTGKMSIPTQTLAKKEFIRLAGNKAQGIAAYIKEYKYYQLEDLINKNKKFQPNLNKSVKVILALDSITDPHNLGAIIRSAVAFGVENIIITKHKSAQVTPSVWKASAGQVSKVRIAKVSSLTNALKILK